MILDSKKEGKNLDRMAAGIPRSLYAFNVSCMKFWCVVIVIVIVVVVVVVVIPKHFIVATFKKITAYLNAVILPCLLSSRYEGTLSSVSICF